MGMGVDGVIRDVSQWRHAAVTPVGTGCLSHARGMDGSPWMHHRGDSMGHGWVTMGT